MPYVCLSGCMLLAMTGVVATCGRYHVQFAIDDSDIDSIVAIKRKLL